MLCALGPESRCSSVANTLYLFHNQREVDDFFAGKAEWQWQREYLRLAAPLICGSQPHCKGGCNVDACHHSGYVFCPRW
jgi:hypothetical protein